MAERKIFKVEGLGYGKDEKGNRVDFDWMQSDHEKPKYLKVCSQFGWEDGCKRRYPHYLKNPIVKNVNPGNIYYTGISRIEAEELSDEEREKIFTKKIYL